MKLNSSIIIIPAMAFAAMSLPGIALAECPSQLIADDMHECIMMEGNGDLSYRVWAPGFYKEIDPKKSAAILEAYQAEDLKAAKNPDPEQDSSISVSSAY